jgi:hypothetical protein
MLQETVAMQIIATVAGGQEELLLSRDDWLLDILSLLNRGNRQSTRERAGEQPTQSFIQQNTGNVKRSRRLRRTAACCTMKNVCEVTGGW